MKNLNEPRRKDENVEPNEVVPNPRLRPDAEVVPFQARKGTGVLIPKRLEEELRTKWSTIQSNFVDQPRKAVEDADNLVAAAIKHIEELFATQRGDLEKKWHRGDEVSTEELRIALQHYRQFFDHLLSITDKGSD